jgi:hypothetical protein
MELAIECFIILFYTLLFSMIMENKGKEFHTAINCLIFFSHKLYQQRNFGYYSLKKKIYGKFLLSSVFLSNDSVNVVFGLFVNFF